MNLWHRIFCFSLIFVLSLGLVSFGVISCSSGDDDDDNNDDSSGDYFPNGEGTVWLYNATDYESGTQSEGRVAISGTANFGGVACQRVSETDSAFPNEELRRYVVDTGSEVRMYGYEILENGQIVESLVYPTYFANYSYPFSAGQEWTVLNLSGIMASDLDPNDVDDIDGDGQPDSVDILISGKVLEQTTLTVPAGTFNEVYKIQIYFSVTIHSTLWGNYSFNWIDEHYWFAPYVGILKTEEFDMDDGSPIYVSELKSYTLG